MYMKRNSLQVERRHSDRDLRHILQRCKIAIEKCPNKTASVRYHCEPLVPLETIR